MRSDTMSKRGENIYKRKDGRWEGRYIKFYDENGKAKLGYVYAKTYSEAKNKLMEQKNFWLNKNESAWHETDISYSYILTSWLDFSQMRVKESTYARYVHIVERHIRPKLGNYKLAKISTKCVEEYVVDALKNGRLDHTGGLSEKTVIDILIIIKSSMSYAKHHGYITKCDLSRICIKNTEKEIKILSMKEQQQLTQVLLADLDFCKFGILLALYTGIRIGELCALTWEDFNIEEKFLKIYKTMQRIQNVVDPQTSKTKVIVTEPKSRSSIRIIPLPEFIIEIAKNIYVSPKVFILTGKENSYLEPRTIQNRFQIYLKQGGIRTANFHSLRHTFATRCVELGFEIKTLSEILGHSNVNITLNRYVHSSYHLKCENMNKLQMLI